MTENRRQKTEVRSQKPEIRNQNGKKVVLITGGAKGLGKAIALEFARKGFCIALNYHTSEKMARETVDQIIASKGDAAFFKTDIGDMHQITDMIKAVMEKWQRIDVLVNNAGITDDAQFITMTENQWDRVIEVNLTGVFNICRAALRSLCKGGGSVINISSYLGLSGGFGAANYAAAKAGVIGITKSLAKEYGTRGIRINAVCPGFMMTDMNKDLSEKAIDRVKEQNTLKRLNNPEEVAQFIVHLAGMKSVSGQVFNLDSRIIP